VRVTYNVLRLSPSISLAFEFLGMLKFTKGKEDCDMIRETLQLPNIAYASDKGVIKAPGGDVPITEVSAHFSSMGDVIIEGTIDAKHPKNINNCDIVFQDDSGWTIIGEKFSIFKESVSIQAGTDLRSIRAKFKAKGHKLIAKHGKISSTDRVNIYKIVTDINFAGDIHVPGLREFVVKFTTDKLKPLMLIKSNIPEIPRSVGYFEVVDTYDNYNKIWEDIFDNLLLLFKFAASNIINFPVIYIRNSLGDELIELTPYIIGSGNGSSIFYLSYPGALSELVDSTFTNLVSLRDTLDLDKAILNYVEMKNHRFTESAYLHGCVLVAGLAYFYAKNVKKYTQEGNRTLKSSGNYYSFEELIDELYRHYDITNFDMNFIKYRDEILNQGGLYSISFENIILEKLKFEAIIEHLLLNILQFDGLYWDRSSRQWVEYKSITLTLSD